MKFTAANKQTGLAGAVRHGLQVECDFRALRHRSGQLTEGIQTAESLIATQG